MQQTIFRNGVGGYPFYRIPALISTPRGTLLALCEGRPTAEDSGDVDVLLRRSTDGGRSWSEPAVVADFGPDTVGNPTLVVERRSGAVHLLLTSNPGATNEAAITDGKGPGTRTVWATRSRDDGRTWATPREITAAVKRPGWTWYATGPGSGIQLRSGRLVIPCDHTEAGTNSRFSHVVYSDDAGETWHLGGSAGPGTNECAVAELADGSLLLNMRRHPSNNAGQQARRYRSYSHDAGLRWTVPVPDGALPDPVCQASLLRLHDGSLLFSNPGSEARRERMTVRLSRDDGRSWSHARVLYPGPAAYSSLAELPDGSLGCLYECGVQDENETITFARFGRAWLIGAQ